MYANSNPVLCILICACCNALDAKYPQWACVSRVFWNNENVAIIELSKNDDFVNAMFAKDEDTMRAIIKPMCLNAFGENIIDIVMNDKK